MNPIRLTTPLRKEDVGKLRAKDVVTITGTIVTARDKAYARVVSGKRPPLDLRGAVVYNCGPIVIRKNKSWEIVSAGPTTSARMGKMQVEFVKRTGVRAILGKGGVDKEIASELTRLGCIYLAFPGGTGALAAESVSRVEDVHWLDLGSAEAMWVLRVREFGPLLTAIDTKGNNLYSSIRKSKHLIPEKI